MRRAAAVLAAFAMLATACSAAGDGPRTYHARFSRAIQVFPAVKVRVLGVDVGVVTSVRTSPDGVTTTLRVDRPDVRIPADVRAAIVPMSLLGERYIQLFPAYRGGPTLEEGATIPLSRTAVPSEPDELLASLQDYLGALDPDTVGRFVENAADVVRGRGEEVNRLLEHAAGVESALEEKREDLATLVVQLNRLTVALATRQAALGRLIRTYNAVTDTINTNRAAVEGTVRGLSDAARELASLLVDHRRPLDADIDSLTRTSSTLRRNVGNLALTARWATRLFSAASRAIDQRRDWLRLHNQGAPLAELILLRLQQRLVELCRKSGASECASPAYWRARVPSLFCFEPPCAAPRGRTPAEELAEAIDAVEQIRDRVRERDRANGGDGTTNSAVEELLDDMLEGAEAGVAP